MKKVGILTFHRADNSGAVLQAYALCRFIQDELNVDAEIIDYQCTEVEKTRFAKNENVIKKIPMMIYYAIKRRGFDSFRKKYLPLSSIKYTKKSIVKSNSSYNTFIVGSDQVWNIGCSGNDDTFFLDFVGNDNRKVAYAASVGAIEFKEEERNKIFDYLKKFHALSIRESSAIIKIGLQSDIPVLPDPVFLLEKQHWNKFTKNSYKKKYIFVYLIQEDVHVMKAAVKYAKEHHFDIIINKKSISYILKNSPDYFLRWIANAEAVFTNSFHGTAFSILFDKILGADIELKNGHVNNRIKELLLDAGLEGCIISDHSLLPQCASSEEWLMKMRAKAKEYLMNNV